jgi:hypothetical protein
VDIKTDYKVKYYIDSNGTKRRSIPKIRMSKKERIRKRWEGKESERFKNTGRGNTNVEEIERVKDFLRSIHPETARKFDIAKATGLGQDRILIIINLLSGVSEDKKEEDAEFVPKDFLVFDEDDEKDTHYGIWKDIKLGIKYGEKQ